MKKLICLLIIGLLLSGCSKDTSAGAPAMCAPSPHGALWGKDAAVTDNYFDQYNANFVTEYLGERWFKEKDEDYIFSLDASDRLTGANQGMIFNDDQCSDLIGEVYNYPLNIKIFGWFQQRPRKVFQFENQIYEYTTSTRETVDGYYFKNLAGECNPCLDEIANDIAVVVKHIPTSIQLFY